MSVLRENLSPSDLCVISHLAACFLAGTRVSRLHTLPVTLQHRTLCRMGLSLLTSGTFTPRQTLKQGSIRLKYNPFLTFSHSVTYLLPLTSAGILYSVFSLCSLQHLVFSADILVLRHFLCRKESLEKCYLDMSSFLGVGWGDVLYSFE